MALMIRMNEAMFKTYIHIATTALASYVWYACGGSYEIYGHYSKEAVECNPKHFIDKLIHTSG